MTAPLRSLLRTPGVVAWKARRIVARIARMAWRRAPLSPAARMRIKNSLFKRAPWLFGHMGAYRNWKAARCGTVASRTGRDYASWGIVTPPHTLFVAEAIARRLQHHGWNTDTMTEVPDEFFHDVYVVICPQIFERLPPYEKLVSFQMEQFTISRWFDEEYLNILKHSFAVLEYATHNFPFLKSNGIAYPHIHYLPIGGIRHYIGADSSLPKTCDVLFYGDDLGSPRRLRLLSELRKKFDVCVRNDVFGPPMERMIREARVVVNLHYCQDALLETPRIWQCLSLGTPVVSETAKDQDEYLNLEGAVRFFEQGSVDSMLLAVEETLESPPSRRVLSAAVEASSERFSFMFDRFLVVTNFLSSTYIKDIALPIPDWSGKIVISMPETFERRRIVRANSMLDDWILFDGIRRHPPWLGCGLSLKTLAIHAMREGVDRLIVAEDDVVLPDNFSKRLEVINRFLDRSPDSWHIFSGLISDLHENTSILSVEEFEGMKFVTIDKMTSTVFCLYNRKSMQMLALWDEKNVDSHANTIDRFIENQRDLRIVVTVPFLVGHREEVDSVLWGFSNATYSRMIEESENRLRNMLLAFDH